MRGVVADRVHIVKQLAALLNELYKLNPLKQKFYAFLHNNFNII